MVDEWAELAELGAFGSVPDEVVAQSPAERARELSCSVGAARELERKFGSGAADRLTPQERRRVVVACKLLGKHDGILHRLGCALTDPGRRRVRGVAEHDCSERPKGSTAGSRRPRSRPGSPA